MTDTGNTAAALTNAERLERIQAMVDASDNAQIDLYELLIGSDGWCPMLDDDAYAELDTLVDGLDMDDPATHELYLDMGVCPEHMCDVDDCVTGE